MSCIQQQTIVLNMLQVKGVRAGHELSMSAFRLLERHGAWGSQAAWLALSRMMKMRTS